MLHFIDFEVFAHDWLCVIMSPTHKTKEVIVNDRDKLKAYYEKYKNEIFVGYNIRRYDQFIFKGILLGFNPKDVNDWIIVKDRTGWKYSDLFWSKDVNITLYDVIPGKVGLKKLEAFMGNNIKESDVDFLLNRKLNAAEIAQTIEYCTHDVEQTMQVFLYRMTHFDAVRGLRKEFNLPLSDLGKTDAQLAATILGATKRTYDDEWNIRLPDTARLGKYAAVGEWFLNPENQREKAMLSIDIAGVPHDFGWGGVHGAVKNYIHECAPDEIMLMVDVDQLYPTLMIEYNILSRSITMPERFASILKTSLELKAKGEKKKREPFKLICNVVSGAGGDETNPMYDPLNRNLVCVFGMTLMVDLIDKIDSFCELIQSNTDGVLLKLKRADLPKLDAAITEWERRTRLHMSRKEYKKVIQKDVNNYIVVAADGSYTGKGVVVKAQNPLDYDCPIINEAALNYFIHGIPPEVTIRNCNELIKFQQICHVSRNFDYGLHGLQPLKERTNRVFASKDLTDGAVSRGKNGQNPIKFADTSTNCFIVNDDVKNKPVPEKLDRDFYINLVYRKINKFLGKE